MSQTGNQRTVVGMRVIQVSVEHVDLVAPLLDRYRQFYGFESEPVRSAEFMQERLGNLQSVVFCALGETEGREEAMGFAQLYPSFSTLSLSRIWNLNDLFVAPEFRRHGAGRALLERSRKFAEATGSRGLVFSTAHDNPENHALYHAVGFVRDDEFHHYFLAV